MKNQKRTVKFLRKNQGNVKKTGFKKRRKTPRGNASAERQEVDREPLSYKKITEDVDDNGSDIDYGTDSDEGDLAEQNFRSEDVVEETKADSPQRKRKRDGVVQKHKSELDALKEKDPQFYEFLQQNDQSLLQFGDDDSDAEGLDDADLDSDGDNNEDEEEETAARASSKSKKKGAAAEQTRAANREVVVTQEFFEDLLDKAETEATLQALKKILSIFRSGCAAQLDDSKQSRYSINDPEVYEFVMANTITKVYAAFYRQLDLSPEKLQSTDNLKDLSKHRKWKQMELLVLSFFKSVLFLISKTADKELKAFIIGSLEVYIPLLAPMPRLTKTVLKTMLLIWSTLPTENEGGDDEQNLRAHAFLRVRQMAIVLPAPTLEDALKMSYIAFARTARTFNEHTASSVTFMTECLVELYGLEMGSAYQTAFVYVRQLALHLRAAMVKKTPESIRQITSWQFLNCVRVWTRILCKYPSKDALYPLVYPFCQVVLGVVGVAQSPRLIPFRLHLLSCLQQLAAAAEVFIPTAAKLLDVLNTPDFTAKPIKSTDAAPNIYFTSRLAADASKKQPVQNALIQETIELLQHDVEIYRYSVGFPEYAFVPLRRLRAFAKSTKIGKWRALARAVIDQIETMAKWVERRRSALSVAPKDVGDFETLRPAEAQPASVRFGTLLQRHNAKARALQTVKNIKMNPYGNSSRQDEDGSDDEIQGSEDDEGHDDVAQDDDDDDEAVNDEEEEEEEEIAPAPVKRKKQKPAKVAKARPTRHISADALQAPDEVKQMAGGDLGWSDDDDDL